MIFYSVWSSNLTAHTSSLINWIIALDKLAAIKWRLWALTHTVVFTFASHSTSVLSTASEPRLCHLKCVYSKLKTILSASLAEKRYHHNFSQSQQAFSHFFAHFPSIQFTTELPKSLRKESFLQFHSMMKKKMNLDLLWRFQTLIHSSVLHKSFWRNQCSFLLPNSMIFTLGDQLWTQQHSFQNNMY